MLLNQANTISTVRGLAKGINLTATKPKVPIRSASISVTSRSVRYPKRTSNKRGLISRTFCSTRINKEDKDKADKVEEKENIEIDEEKLKEEREEIEEASKDLEDVEEDDLPEEEEEPPVPLPPDTETVTGPSQKHEFQAETRKLLDIVARSLYTDKEVFIRELISNASDALEKLRHLQLTGGASEQSTSPFEIQIWTDPKSKTLIIQDTGIGMTKEELIGNLGAIGHSGSLDFVNKLENKSAADIIGQFGVGFYSVFMVANSVTVYSKSATTDKGYCWTSDGSGTYDIQEADGVARGTKIVIRLNDKSTQFAQKEAVETIIKKYSNFVGFPIHLNGKQVNTIKALWTMNKNDIKEEDHKEFYQFIAHSYDEPMFTLMYSTDSPINIRSLFYIGQQHSEKYGMGRMQSGISLFSRKVLIKPKAEGILPDYLRFVKGVVDSEDLPLNLSREHLQDSALVKRIGNVITKRVLKWLDEEAKRDPKKYNRFFEEFGSFLREGVCTDLTFKEDLAKLLRVESSHTKDGEYTSLDQYIERMDKDQKDIFFLCIPSRDLADTSPYYESFKAQKKEVLFLFTTIDDFVMTNLAEYKGKKLVSIESTKANAGDKPTTESSLSKEELKTFIEWMKDTLSGKVSSIKESTRLVESPAIIVDHDSASFRRMMKYVDPSRAPTMPKQQLEINPSHALVKRLNEIREQKPGLAKLVAEQIFDDALVAAGLLDDSRSMLPRLNKLLISVLETDDIPMEMSGKKKKSKAKEEKRETAFQEPMSAPTHSMDD